MHYWASGIWQPTLPMSNETVEWAVGSKSNMSSFAWTFEDRIRMDGCYTCDATKCECAADSEARGCWDDNISTLGATLGSLDTENTWRKYVERRRVGQAPQRQQTSGCEVGVTGTLQRAPTANQDPVFYLHHSFTFMVSELAMRHLRNDSSRPSGLYFGLDSLHGVRECAAATITVTSPSLLPTSCLTHDGPDCRRTAHLGSYPADVGLPYRRLPVGGRGRDVRRTRDSGKDA